MKRRILLIIGLFVLVLGASAKRVGAYCYFANDGSQLYEDDNVKVELAMESKNLVLVIHNKTSEAIYVDGENSFIYNNGGIVGSLNSVTQENALMIAPESKRVLYTWKNLNTMFVKSLIQPDSGDSRGRFIDPTTGYKERFEKGLSRKYTKEETPFTVRGVIKYSTNKELKSATKVTVSNYITDIIIDSYKGVKNPNYALPHCKGKQADYAYVSGTPFAGTFGGLLLIVEGAVAILTGTILMICL